MSYYRNLVPGQMQIGDIVFGYGTNIKLENTDVKPYDIDAQDYQVSFSDEKRFGQDSFKPSTIEFSMQVLHNRLLSDYQDIIPNFWHSMPNINDLARQWRADDIRRNWGQMQPLYICSKLDGIPKIIFGRTGQFGYTFDDEFNQGEVVKVLAEFRRADTLSYGVEELGLEITINEDPVYIVRDEGDGPDAWMRILLYGPMTNPVITVGENQIQLNHSIPDGKVVEISSYPWQRRIVDSDRVNLSSNMVGTTKYLDLLKLPYRVPVPVKWTSTASSTWVPYLGNQKWMEDIGSYNEYGVPDTFDVLIGQAGVRFDLFNFGSSVFPWFSQKYYLGAAINANETALIYNAKKFGTQYQNARVKIVEPKVGKSAIVIMSKEDMSDFACLIVENTISNRRLYIASGTSITNLTVRSQWDNPAMWHETDMLEIKYDPETLTYEGFLNGTSVISWEDSTMIVPTGTDNRSQGFLFDIDGNQFTSGIGFSDILVYDSYPSTLEVEPITGKVILLWRDTYSVI